ncbi:branched-chain amino acid ABC transporter ATP-binding protein/permease [Bordetella petrii]|uniref:Branched-chain amino acid transport system protein n=1 Tax=Bordetella petrii (strain ATCC BAA-461 / DSM 12804 / CCUG 43448 / CIP 107267 / Se-1111R) TaxID=340100 RepID=A9IHV5_BORPD|nr:branched-chain amino acid ABC transporter ATP-binding protein/permease [Bordetella petrii]CAP41994.1 putative branched-chain amino acid transport system protein [Bordetella petrii]
MKSMRTFVIMLAVAAAYLGAALLVDNSYHQLIFTLVLVWACFGLSWNMLSGYTGLVSFGHAAFFGLGAYAAVLGQINLGLSPWLMIPLAAVIGAVAGLLVGLPTFRLRGHYFALAMLAYPLALLYVFEWLGYQEVTFPMVRENPAWFMQFSNPWLYTVVAMAMLLLFVQITRYVERTRFGMALIAIKQNEAAAEAAGIDTLRWKLKAIALSGAIAGATGAFYAVVLLVVTPVSVFGMLVSAQALTVAMFGGVGTVWGPIIGAAILIPLGEILHAELGATYPGIQGVILGAAIIAVILVAPEGVFWKTRDFLRRRGAVQARAALPEQAARQEHAAPMAESAAPQEAARRPAGGEVILDVAGLSRSFGGLKAVQNVSFQVRKGMILGIIGPNGAGKTTLFNLLNGFLKPDAGRVVFKGADMAGRKPHVLCAAGVGRTFQVMRPFMRLTVAQNVKVGAYVKARSEAEAEAMAAQAIERVGLTDCADRLASVLTTRQLRLMELARAVAGQPELLLLDETLAGLGQGEVDDVVSAIRALSAQGITIVIIEHTMQAMVRLVDQFVVLDHGEVLAVGEPQAITRDMRVIEAYLGKKWSARHAA